MDSSKRDAADRMVTRRRVLQVGLGSVAMALVPGVVDAKAGSSTASNLVNPYSGSIPMVSPLPSGSYQPLSDNWHASREGQLYTWSHRDGKFARAHDGVDLYPSGTLPAVYAPFPAIISAVCVRSNNSLNATVDYRTDPSNPPPWNYSNGVDNVANLPLYGNFIWLKSVATDASKAYFAFYCHLQNDSALSNLLSQVGSSVTSTTRVGTMGDTGNAQGTPQLHVEIHYPIGNSYTCSHCSPHKSGLTAIDPAASLAAAASR